MIETNLDIIKVESDLKTLENANPTSEVGAELLSEIADKERDRQIREEFQNDPEVIQLSGEIAEADEQRAQAKRRARAANDPARQLAEQKYKKLRIDYDKLWEVKYKEIVQRLKASRDNPPETESLIVVLKSSLESLKTRRAEQAKAYAKLIEENQDSKAKK